MTLDDCKNMKKWPAYENIIIVPEDDIIMLNQRVADEMIGMSKIIHSMDMLTYPHIIGSMYINRMNLGTSCTMPSVGGLTCITNIPDVEELMVSPGRDLTVLNCPRLKKITIHYDHNAWCKYYETVTLTGCKSLESVEIINSNDIHLDKLYINDCPVMTLSDNITVRNFEIVSDNAITMLPNSLTVDNRLRISHCDSFKDLNMATMKKLVIDNCSSFTMLEDGYGEMLKKLSITECDNLTYLPTTMCARKISFRGCRGLTALPTILDADKVDIRGCENIVTTNSYGTVKTLIIDDMSGVNGTMAFFPAGYAVRCVKCKPKRYYDDEACDEEYDDFEE